MDDGEKTAMEAMRVRGLDMPLGSGDRRRWQDRFNAMPAMKFSGAVVDLDDPRLIRVILPKIETYHEGGLGGSAVNGAVICGMFDCALGVAGAQQFPGESTGTVELSIKMMRPARTAPLVFYAIATKRTLAICFAESKLFSGNRLCAHCTGMVAVAKKEQSG